jgi:hypothetical protein
MRIALLLLLDHGGACFRQTGQLATAEERQLHNVRQLTFGGRNAEGDLDIYSMDPKGKHGKQLTSEPGSDGGRLYSPDGPGIVYRAYHSASEKEISDSRELLKQNLIRPTTRSCG